MGSLLKIFGEQNVYDEALDRIRRIYDEFPEVVCSMSGGKDSTVVYNLCLQVAREKGRLPLKVLWIDQEAEWECTTEYVKSLMYNPDVDPYWMQIPFKIFNATSTQHDSWLHAWEEGKEDVWIRPKDPIAKKENIYNNDRFVGLFGSIFAVEMKGKKAAYVTGMRAEESLNRYLGMSQALCYKDITWGTIIDKNAEHYSFHPIYDWRTYDVWKAIHDNGWDYCKLYDYMYAYGLPLTKMRVSNITHETAITSLFYLQEFEAENYNRVQARLAGISMANHMGFDDYFPTELPPMFVSWKQYIMYLVEKLIKPERREQFVKKFETVFRRYDFVGEKALSKILVKTILTNDYHFTKLGNMTSNFNHTTAFKARKKELKAKGEY